MSLFKPLLAELHYLSREHLKIVYKAYRLASIAHATQTRDSGEPYVTHPLAVAKILAKMHLDHESVSAAILHDVIEDTEFDKEYIQNHFGESIAYLVDGVTKLSKIDFSNKAEAQAESFRKMVLAMSQDIRVILVKLADRVHNMSTLGGVAPHKRRRIAKETLDIYAPIADRLGMNELSLELQTLAFTHLYPKRKKVLQEAVENIRGNRVEIMENIEKELRKGLQERNFQDAIIIGREKHLFSIYRKMKKYSLAFSEIMDVYGFRIIVNNIDECYRALGLVHSIYKPIPGKFKDYIAIPKYNGYQSLHTKLCGPYGIPLEVQIRTREIDHMATQGIAAHWLYKGEGALITDSSHLRAQQWVNNLLEVQKNTGNSLEFIENVRVDLFPNEVYVFTPKGHIMELPRGATAVDFAYAIHTDVGNTCIATRVNRQFAPLSTVLSSGQTVSIITAPSAKPNPAWLNFVVTSKAISSIKSFLKNQQQNEAIALGKELLSKALSDINIALESVPIHVIDIVLNSIYLHNIDELYESLGLGNRLAVFIAHQIANTLQEQKLTKAVDKNKNSKQLIIKGAEGLAIKFASCCTPIPGDAIVGYFNVGHGLEIHTEDCAELAKKRKNTDQYMPTRWADDVEGEFKVAINVEVSNYRGTLAQLAQAISEAGSSIDDIRMSDCSGGYCLMSLKLMVRNKEHLEDILHSINALSIVMAVVRKR